MLNSPLSASSNELVINILAMVLSEGKPLDRAYSQHFSGLKLVPAEQARIATVTGDILRRLNLNLPTAPTTCIPSSIVPLSVSV